MSWDENEAFPKLHAAQKWFVYFYTHRRVEWVIWYLMEIQNSTDIRGLFELIIKLLRFTVVFPPNIDEYSYFENREKLPT